MKKISRFTLLSLFIASGCIISAAVFLPAEQIKSTNSISAKAISSANPARHEQININTNKFKNVFAAAIEKTYAIKPDANLATYKSYNPANKMWIIYRQDGFSIKPDKNLPQWEIKMQLAGITKGSGILENNEDAEYIFQDNKLVVENKSWNIEYINTPEGMRQNFIVRQKPEGNSALRIRLNFTSDATMKCDEKELLFEKNNELLMAYSDLKVWDANHKILSARMVQENSNLIALEVNDIDAAYPITVDPISSTPIFEEYGAQDNAQYGTTVSGAGDVDGNGYDDVIVGAPNYSSGSFSHNGAVFVYLNSAGGIADTPTYTYYGTQDDEFFGGSVASAGDVNGDGYDDIIVGAKQYSASNTNAGAFFLYNGSASGLPTSASYTEAGSQIGANLGSSVDSAGDVNNDGYSDVIVGALGYTNTFSREGATYVYLGSSGGLSSTPVFTKYGGQTGANFGSSVSSAGDVNGDGYYDIIAGAPFYDNTYTDNGAAYIYLGNSSGVSTTANASLYGTQNDALFGFSVSNAGDVDGDNYDDVIVGAYGYTQPGNGNDYEGAAYVFAGQSPGINSTPVWTVYGDEYNANFGYSVSTAGDVDGDTYSDVIVGGPGFGYYGQGAISVYNGSSGGLSTTPYFTQYGDTSQANGDESIFNIGDFGSSVGSAGDVDANGMTEIIVGDPIYSGSTYFNEGAAYMYGDNTPLPVTLTAFSAKLDKEKKHALLNWTTASEINNDYFLVEKSADGIHFDKIGKVTGNGNSQRIINYTFTDENVVPGITYYRLKQVDFNGAFEYSKIVSVRYNADFTFSVFPNPATNGKVFIDLKIPSSATANGRLQILNAAGQTVQSEAITAKEEISLNPNLKPGLYYLQISVAETRLTKKIMIQ